MNKKKYTEADMEIIWFDTEDIITNSGETGDETGGELEDNDEL